jgi:hypothetical protein
MEEPRRSGSWVLAVVLIVAALVCVSVFFMLAPRVLPPAPGETTTASPSPSGGDGVPEDENEGSVVIDLDDVTPFITSAVVADDGSTVTVRSFVPGLAESEGTCTASVVGGDASEIASGPASLEVSETVCPPLVIPLLPGHEQIKVQVTYESAISQGESEPMGVDIP